MSKTISKSACVFTPCNDNAVHATEYGKQCMTGLVAASVETVWTVYFMLRRDAVTVENVAVSMKSGQTFLPVFFWFLLDNGCARNLLQSVLYNGRLRRGYNWLRISTFWLIFLLLYPRFKFSCAPLTSKPRSTRFGAVDLISCLLNEAECVWLQKFVDNKTWSCFSTERHGSIEKAQISMSNCCWPVVTMEFWSVELESFGRENWTASWVECCVKSDKSGLFYYSVHIMIFFRSF